MATAILVAACLTAVPAAAAVWWLRRTLVLVRVDGPSMAPTLVDGDRVLARRIGPGRARRGRLVLLAPPAEPGAVRPTDPGRLWLVKRLRATAGDPVPAEFAGLPAFGGVRTVPAHHVLVVGDNPDESYDSRQEGFVPQSRLRAVVVRRIDMGGTGDA
ncbi:S26 family signal peptidase [Virgisporangium ochraceum]|uniref:S26 family signal peptidase n=1 Tax=Virgisporangium ochraceum TaxID=65505 RepID=A0A8J4EDD0_9ACTN|nr:S26 family signal peptidase [Virgisporangium ochraceum]GIJ70586.1 S26 family signal peptidase [Virgisporangium ochraceum]